MSRQTAMLTASVLHCFLARVCCLQRLSRSDGAQSQIIGAQSQDWLRALVVTGFLQFAVNLPP